MTASERFSPPYRIAAALLADPSILNLTSQRLERDIVARYGVSLTTARSAVDIARRHA